MTDIEREREVELRGKNEIEGDREVDTRQDRSINKKESQRKKISALFIVFQRICLLTFFCEEELFPGNIFAGRM